MNQERTVRTAMLRPTVALVGALALVLGVMVFFAGIRPASAEDPTSTTSSSVETTTTTEPVTTTTEPVTTTTRRPSTTTTTTTQRQSTTTAPTSSTTLEETTSTTAAPTTTEAPTIITPSTVEGASGGADGGLSTNTKLALVIGGLLAVALAIMVLTVLYWRHTKPAPLPTDDDLDGSAPLEAARVAPVAAATVTTASPAIRSSGPATEEIPAVSSAPAGEPPHDLAPTAAEPAVVLAAAEGGSTGDGSESISELWANGSEAPNSPDEDAALREVLFGSAPVAPANLPPVTLEDLFGSADDPKGPAKP